VQSVGLDVARAARGSGTTDKELVRQYINQRLQPRLREIKQLRGELISPQLAEIWGEERHWSMTLTAENLKAVQTPSGRFVGDFEPFKEVDLQKKQFGILGGILEELRALLEIVRLAGRAQGIEIEFLAWATSLDGRVSPELLSCELVTLADNKIDALKALFCPLKFGLQGMDALRAANEMERFGAAAGRR